MRILALVTDAFGGRGGIAQYNRDLINAFAELGSVSTVLVLPRFAPDESGTQSKIRQFRPCRNKWFYVARALWTSLRHRVDLIFCGHLYTVPLAWTVARLTGAKLVIQMHGIEAWRAPSSWQRRGVEAADLALCVSRHTRSSVLTWASIAPERVVVVPNTVGDDFKPEGRNLREAWGLSGRRVLLTVGRLDSRERYKGHDRVIVAIPQLVAEGHDVVYLILGEGDDRPRLEALARKADIIDRVRFMGLVSHEVLRDAYRTADLFVMPSTGEGFGIAFLEAMASGTPAVGLAVAGAVDALADGELGIAVQPSELATELCRALSTPPEPSKALAASVHERFGRECFASRASAILKHFDPLMSGVADS